MRRLVVLLAGVVAASAAPTPFPHGSVELVSSERRIAASGKFEIGLRFQLEPGWHIYWSNPGDSGQPPKVTWTLPTGLAAGAVEWPVPQVLGTPDIVDYGYQDAVLLPIPITANGLGGGSVALAASLSILICKNECVPAHAQVALSLPVGPAAEPATPEAVKLFNAAHSALPKPMPTYWKVAATEDAKGFNLIVTTGTRLTVAHFFPLQDAQIDYSKPAQIAGTATGAHLRLPKSVEDIKPSTRLTGVLALSNGSAYVIDALVTQSKSK